MIYVTIAAICDCGAEEEAQPMLPMARTIISDIREELVERGWKTQTGSLWHGAVCPSCQGKDTKES